MSRVVAYVRVSTERQASEGASLDAQEARARTYAELHELEIVTVVRDEGASACSLDRPDSTAPSPSSTRAPPTGSS